jgi:hypothetical protein
VESKSTVAAVSAQAEETEKITGPIVVAVDVEDEEVKTSIIACSGLCQMLIRAVWPSMVHSSVQWVASK